MPLDPPPRRMFRLSYATVEKGVPPKLHRCRDAIAADELAAALARDGVAFGTTLYFYPHARTALADFPEFYPSDLIVLATRPPLNDPEPHSGRIDDRRDTHERPQRLRKIIQRNDGELEADVFDAVRRYLRFSNRKKVALTPEAVALLQPRYQSHMGYVVFFENRGRGHLAAQIQHHLVGEGHDHVPPHPHSSTIGYFIHTGPLARASCGLVVSFGMDGFSTLVWNRIVRMRYPDWLKTPGFRMAELVFKRPLPERPITPEFADDSSLIEVRLLTQPAPAHAAPFSPGPRANRQPTNHHTVSPRAASPIRARAR